jgi:hypothetical protein
VSACSSFDIFGNCTDRRRRLSNGNQKRKLAAASGEADVYYTAKVVSQAGGQFVTELQFSNPLLVTGNEKMDFTLTNKQGYAAKLSVDLPKQFPSVDSQNAVFMFSDFLVYMMLVNIVLMILAAGWPLFNTMQLIATLSVLGMQMESPVDFVLKELWHISNLTKMSTTIFGTAPSSFTMKYLRDHDGGLTVVLLPVAMLVSLFCVLLIRGLKNSESPKVKSCVEWMERAVLFRFMIRSVLATYLPMVVLAFAGSYAASSTSSLFSVVQFFSCVVIALWFAAFLFALITPMETLESYNFRKTWGAIYDGLKTNAGKDKLTNVSVFMARRILFVLVLLQDEFYIKWSCLIVLSIGQMAYYATVRPHVEKNMHYLEMFNESMILASLYFLISQTEFITDAGTRYNFAWAFNCLVLLPLIAVNLVHTFFIGVRLTYADFKNSFKKGAKIVIEDASEQLPDDADKVYNYAAYRSEQKYLKSSKLDLDVIEELPFGEEAEIDMVQKEQFLQQMQQWGLELSMIEKDGNCVFRAIGLLLFDDQSKHMQVRHDVVNQLVKHKNKYEQKISGSGSLLGDFTDYTNKMRNEGVWGDHLEL